MAKSRLIGDYPVIGIRPTIDGRRGVLKVRESLEEQTMNMAKSAAKLFEENLRYTNGEPVKVVIADTTIGRVAESAACADKFKKEGVDITLTVTPCWCYGAETMDMDPMTIKAVWGFNGTERPDVYKRQWLTRDCDILIFDEPTRGIDVGAKNEIYKLMNALAAEGKAIIMISSEMTEILRMSDRIVVMCEGKKTGELDISEATQENIMNMATREIESVSYTHLYGGLKTENIDAIMGCREDSLIIDEGGDSKLYTMSKSKRTGWTVVGAAYTSELLKNNEQAQMWYLLVASILLLAVIGISSIISREMCIRDRCMRGSYFPI